MSNERQAELLEDIARCLREGGDPLEKFIYQSSVDASVSFHYRDHEALFSDVMNAPDLVRHQPRTITIHAEIPEPVRERLEMRTKVYFPNVELNCGYGWKLFWGDPHDKRMLEAGYLHLTKEAAIAHEKAMRPFGGGE